MDGFIDLNPYLIASGAVFWDGGPRLWCVVLPFLSQSEVDIIYLQNTHVVSPLSLYAVNIYNFIYAFVPRNCFVCANRKS